MIYRAGGSGSRLFLWSALASLVPVLLLGGVLARSEREAGLHRAVSQGRAQAAVIEQTALAPALDGHDLGLGLSTVEHQRLSDATDRAIFSGSISRLRLRSFDGRVVFSDDGGASSPVPSASTRFREAAAGATSARVTVDAGQDGRSDARVVSVMQPVVPRSSGQAVGVLEVDLPYGPIADLVQRQLRHTYLLLAAGLGLLYLVLAALSWSTTRRLRAYAALQERAALHDHLTGLPNRALFRLQVERAIRQTPPGQCSAVVLVDLDRFKQVNDRLGHHAGDLLLVAVAQRLGAAVRTDDTVARLGGDEFGIVLPAVGSGSAAVEILERARNAVSSDVDLDGEVVRMHASFGVALYPQHGTQLDELLHHADTAMYLSKRSVAGVVLHGGRADGALHEKAGTP